MIRIGCIVQGDLRVPVEPILLELRKYCDVLILSTWEDQRNLIPPGSGLSVLVNAKPAEHGLSNRNLQRLSTAAGLALAEAEGCTHVLKWRTDMLPTCIRREDLLQWAGERPVTGLPGRIVMSAFRNLSADPDWLSSFPDLFAFGEIAAMKLLWSDEGFDYTRDHNLPPRMVDECQWCPVSPGRVRLGGGEPEEIRDTYNAHVECYALFKDRLERTTGRTWCHGEVARDALRLIDHHRLGICWLKMTGRIPYRSIMQAALLPWWTEAAWERGRAPRLYLRSAPVSRFRKTWWQWVSFARLCHEVALQVTWHRAYQKRTGYFA